MANSPLYVAPKPFAWDYSGVFSDVQQRGQIGLQLASPGASRSRTSNPKSPDFEYKGEAAWWANEHNAEQIARSNLHNLLTEYGNDARGAMADPRFTDNVSVINQARSYPQNELRGQQLEKKKKFEDQYKEKKNELVVVNGEVLGIDESGKPATVEEYTSFGTRNPIGSMMSWEASATDGKGFEDSLEKTFGSLRFNESKQPTISLDSVSPDIGNPLNLFLNTTYGHKGNSQQMNDAVSEATNSMFNTRKNDILSWYMKTEDYKNKASKPVSEGGFMNGKKLDPSAIMNAIRTEKLAKYADGSPKFNEDGSRATEISGWFPERLREMAKKYGWSSNTETVSGGVSSVSKQMEGVLKSQDFISMIEGRFSSSGEDQKGYFLQDLPGDGTFVRTDNKSGFLIRDLNEYNTVNKKLGYASTKDASKTQPYSKIYDGVMKMPGVVINENGQQVSYIDPLKIGSMPIYVTPPSSKWWIGTDVTKIPSDHPLGENDETDRALYHTFEADGGVIMRLDDIRKLGLKAVMPNERDLDETQVKLGKAERVRIKTPNMRGQLVDQGETVIRQKTGTRINPTDHDGLKMDTEIPLADILEDDDLREEFNKAWGAGYAIAEKSYLESANIMVDPYDLPDTKYVRIPEAMIKSGPVSVRNMNLVPDNIVFQTAIAKYGGDINKMINSRTLPPVSEVEQNILQQSIR